MTDQPVDDSLDVKGRQHVDSRIDYHGFEFTKRLHLEGTAHDEEEVCNALVTVEDGVEQMVEMRLLHGKRCSS